MMIYILLTALSISMLYGHAHATGSQYSGQWSLTGCSPANSTTCSNFFTPINEIYYVADTLAGTLYYIPYSPVSGSVNSLTYNGATVNLTTTPLCQGTWTNAGVTASCSDGSTVSIVCNSGPCKSSPSNPTSNLSGIWSTTSYCKSYITTCSTFFGPTGSNFTVTVNGGTATLTSTTLGFQANFQTYSDGTMMVASSTVMCFGRPSPLQSSNFRIVCGSYFGYWAETDFQCVSGACLPKPSGASIISIESIVTISLITLLLFFFNIY
jgi:hypothetical protein